jgi:hypothetical protein
MTHGRMAGANALRYRDGLHEAQTAFTPDYVLEPIRKVLGGIELDPCSTVDNPTRATFFFAPPRDGLALPWLARTIFVNPPYGKAREPWVQRCIEAAPGRKIVLLIPAHTDTKCFQKAAASATSVVFIRSRVKFGVLRPNRRQVAASHPSALIAWGVDVTKTNLGIGWCV